MKIQQNEISLPVIVSTMIHCRAVRARYRIWQISGVSMSCLTPWVHSR